MIAHGERPTTCLSVINGVTRDWDYKCCRECAHLEPWQIYRNTSEAVVRGIRSAGSNAEYISWFYQPQVLPQRAPWVADCARHVPDGVTFIYNFESGAGTSLPEVQGDEGGRSLDGSSVLVFRQLSGDNEQGGRRIVVQRFFG